MTDEIRVVSSSGGTKGQKPRQMSQLPMDVIMELTEQFSKGEAKYGKFNWQLGYDWSLSYDALCRHLFDFWQGVDVDEETRSRSLMGVLFHAIALAWFQLHRPQFDDRPNTDADTAEGHSPEEGEFSERMSYDEWKQAITDLSGISDYQRGPVRPGGRAPYKDGRGNEDVADERPTPVATGGMVNSLEETTKRLYEPAIKAEEARRKHSPWAEILHKQRERNGLDEAA